MLGNIKPIPLHLATRVVLITACGCRRIIKYEYKDRDTITMMIFKHEPVDFFSLDAVPIQPNCIYRDFIFEGKYDEETSLPVFEEIV